MYRYTSHFIFIIFLTILTTSCGGGGGSTATSGGTDDPTGSTTPLPGSFPATSNIYIGDTYTDDEVSIDTNGQSIIRTKLSILFDPTATVAEVDGLLSRINATVTSSIKGARSVNIRIPDPGTVAELDTIIADIKQEPFVDAALKSIVIKPAALPDNITEESQNDYRIIAHQLAVGGAAAWNAKEAITQAPNLIIMDMFGAGASQLNNYLDANITGTVFSSAPDASDHGYHVAGIATGSFGGDTSTSGLVTGIFPGQSNLHIIDLSNKISGEDANALALITAASTSGTVVMNTSLGFDCETTVTGGGAGPLPPGAPCRDITTANVGGIIWTDLVRSAGLETKLFHATAASNRANPRYDARDTETQHPFSTAATMLMDTADITLMSTEEDTQVPNLTNTMVVENLVATIYHPAKITCLSENSFVGGTISAVGNLVTSLTRTGTAKLSGTSMATPQVAGLAAYLLSIDDSLSPQKIIEILLNTSQNVPSPTNDPFCSGPSAPAIDAYAAVLALDKSSALKGSRSDAPVRNAILDIAGDMPALGKNGRFDENDLLYYIEQIEIGSEEIRQGNGKVLYSRADLNGDGYNGGGADSGGETYKKKLNLDIDYPPQYTKVQQTIEGETVFFDENALTDNDILCYYAYSNLYTGDTTERKNLMAGRCLPGVVAVYYQHSNNTVYPGAPCGGGADTDASEVRETISTIDSYETFVNRPSDHFWHAGDFDIQRIVFEATELSGTFNPVTNLCTNQSFYAYSELNSRIEHSDIGSKIAIDVTAVAGSECYEVPGDQLWQCSSASARTTTQADYIYDIKSATTLKMVLSMSCTGPNVSPPGYPDPAKPLLLPPVDLSVRVLRTNPAGDGIAQHQDVAKWLLPQNYYCNDDSPEIDVEQLIEFDAPANEGDIDQAIITIVVNAGATGNQGNISVLNPVAPTVQPGQLGIQINKTTLFGYVEVVPAN